MKVKELIDLLSKYPSEHIVVMSSDAEGNSFSPLSDLSEEMYEPESTWSGQVVQEEDAGEDYSFNAIVLIPVN